MQSPIILLIKNTEAEAVKNKIKIFRAMHGLTQEQLAEKIDVTRQTIIAIESNRYLPSLGLAFKIANTFEVKIEDIFNNEENNEN